LGDVLRRVIKNNFQISRELDNVDINTECKEAKDGLSCTVFISGFIDDLEIAEEHTMQVRLKRSVCDVCSRQSGGYYEAIVQIRPDKVKLTRRELDDITSTVGALVEGLQADGNRALFITDMGVEHGGLDFYISERSAGLVIAKKIQEQYGGIIKQSSKNIGMKDSRQTYRVTYLVRLSPYKKSDFLKFNDAFFHIISIHRNKVKMMDISSWEETVVDAKTIQNASIIGGEDLIKEMILVSQTKDEVQIMDQKKYEINIVKKPKLISFDSKMIKVVKIEDKLFLIP
jgi:nonsense-mediated mRNA decay protein 3